MRILLGYDIKSKNEGVELSSELLMRGYEVEVFLPPDRYPKIADGVTYMMGRFKCPGPSVLVCQTGIGMCIVANKYPGIRAVNGDCIATVEHARERNDCNVLCLASIRFRVDQMVELVERFVNSEYKGESDENLKLIREIERRNFNAI